MFSPRSIPASDHYDGKRFFVPKTLSDARPVNFLDVLKWQFGPRRTRRERFWPSRVQLESLDTPPARITGQQLRLSYIGHATVLLQTAGLNILTDPVYSRRASPFSFMGPKRVHPPGIAWESLPKIDLVLLSHNHYDHLDMATLKKLVDRDAPLIVTPLGNGRIIARHAAAARIVELDWGETHSLGLPNNPYQSAAVTLEPALHWSSRSGFDRNRALWGSFVVKTAGGTVYFGGDSGYGPHFRAIAGKHGPFRAALLPIGAFLPRWFMAANHMAPDEAVAAHRDLGSPPSVALHYCTFRLADDGFGEAARELASARVIRGVEAEAFRLLPPGQSWMLAA